MLTNNSSQPSQIMKNKQEQFHIQIRKERREEVFKQKRVIYKQTPTMEQVQLNPEHLEQHITDLMEASINIYRHTLPNDFDKMMNNFQQLRRIQIMDHQSDTFTLCLFKKDFIEFILVLLAEQFDSTPNLQTESGTILANFFGSMDKNSKYYFNTYIPTLNVLGERITKAFGRLLYSKHLSLVDSCLYALGNVFADQDLLVQKFKQQFGLKYLLNVSQHMDTIVWVLDTLTNHEEYFTNDEMLLAISILDRQLQCNDIQNQVHSLSSIRNFSSYQLDVIPLIINMVSFPKIVEIAKTKSDLPNIHQATLEIMFSLSKLADRELMQKQQQKYDLIDLYVTYLSSHDKEYRIKALKSLENLCDLDVSFAVQISAIPYFIEKSITLTMFVDQKQIKGGVDLIVSMLQYNLLEMNELFVTNNVFHLLSKLLEYVNDEILEASLTILKILLGSIDRYHTSLQIQGDDFLKSKVHILNLINQNRIVDQLTLVFQNREQDSITDLILRCLDRIESAQQDVDNY